MHILGALDVPTSGKYILNGKDITSMTKDELARVRNKNIVLSSRALTSFPG